MFASLCCWLWLGAGAGLVSSIVGQEMPDSQAATSQPVSTDPTPTTGPAQMGSIRLSADVYPEGVAGPADYDRYLRVRTTELLAAADGAKEPLVEAEARLRAANWILGRQVEPQVSRLLLGIELPGDLAALRTSVAQAHAQLEAAGRLLDDPGKRTGHSDAPAHEQDRLEEAGLATDDLLGVYEDLSAFAEALAVAWAPAEEEDLALRAGRCASALGVLLEDDRPGVASAAMLYQALLYRRADRLERALSVLDLALRPLPAEDKPIAFLARLLRCRYLAQQGGYTVAWALLLALEERAREWFDSPGQRARATRAVGLLRLEVANTWRQALEQAGKTEQATWCERATGQLGDTLRGDSGPPVVTRLGRSLPCLLKDCQFDLSSRVFEPQS